MKRGFLFSVIVSGIVMSGCGKDLSSLTSGLSKKSGADAAGFSQLKQIVLAAHTYHDYNRCFPPAGTGEKIDSGLSWRVMLLPHLGEAEKALYEQFHLDEPWNSEHNKSLISQMPDVYKSNNPVASGMTRFQVFTAPGAVFNLSGGPARMRDVVDGTINTIFAIEVAPELATEWTKPGGIAMDPARVLTDLPVDPVIGGTPCATTDGGIAFIDHSDKSAKVAEDLARLIKAQDREISHRYAIRSVRKKQ